MTCTQNSSMNTQQSNRQKKINWFAVAPGVWGIKDIFVNIYLVHLPAENGWVLVDAGLKSSGSKIKKVAEHLFWPDIAPKAIILTHAHFDHVGSLRQLAEEWDVPVYAHTLEEPFLIGVSSYPPPDPSVGGGMMSLMSWAYPKGPIDISDKLYLLPEDGTIPFMPEWTYIHTPGHAPGHISLFRKRDGVLLAGDAFVTTRQESAIAVMRQEKELNGPPKYFTYNWTTAGESVKKLTGLDIQIAATGHGKPMSGDELRNGLYNLSVHFIKLAVPAHGRYVDDPAMVNREGVQYLPPSKTRGLVLKAVGITAAAIFTIMFAKKKLQHRNRFIFSKN